MPKTIIGNYYIGNSYTFRCNFQATQTFCKKRTQVFFQLNSGTHKFFITRLAFTFQRQSGALAWVKNLDGIGVDGMYYYDYNYTTNPVHSLIVQYDGVNNQLRIYVDNYLVSAENTACPAINSTWQVATGDNAAFDDFTGILTNVTFETNATLPSGILTKPTPQYNPYDYPDGYVIGGDASACDDIFTQEALCVPPTYGGAVSPLGFACNLEQMFGWDGGGNSPSQGIIDDVIAFNQILVDTYGYVFLTISDMEAAYQFQADPTFYMIQYIDYVIANPPATTIQVNTNISALQAKGGHNPVDLAAVVYTDPDSVMDDDKFIYDVYGTFVFGLLGNIPMIIAENGEGAGLDSNGNPQPARTQSRVSKWNYTVSDMLATLSNADFEVYDVYDLRVTTLTGRWIDYDHDVCNTGYGQVSLYNRFPSIWYKTVGAYRGFDFVVNEKYYELNATTGVQMLNRPWMAFGWDQLPENNHVFHQQLSLAKLTMAGMGCDSARLGFFRETGDPLQDGRLWWHQLLALAYTQAIRSYYPQFYTGAATLLDGDLYIDQTTETKNSKVFWTGSCSCLLTVRKVGTEYLFVMGYMVQSNYIGQPATYDFTVTVDGFTHDFSSRQQGDVIYWDSTNPLVYEQRDYFHQQSHPTYWFQNQVAPIVTTPLGDLDRTIPCGDAAGLAAALALFPSCVDDTDPNPVMTENTPVITNGGVCPYTITRSWFFTDLDSNVSLTFYQLITIFVNSPSNMAVVEQNTLTTIPSAMGLYITDATGAYSVSNTGGYNAPNADIADFISYVSTITVPDSSTYQATGTEYPIDLFGLFPTVDTELTQTITSLQLGMGATTVISTGIYKLYTVASTATDDYTYTNYYLFFPRIETAVNQLLLNSNCSCDCIDPRIFEMENMVSLIKLQWSYGETTRAICVLEELINLLAVFGKTNLG